MKSLQNEISSFNDFVNDCAKENVELVRTAVNHIVLGLPKITNVAALEKYPMGIMNISRCAKMYLPEVPARVHGLKIVLPTDVEDAATGLTLTTEHSVPAYWLPVTNRKQYGLDGIILTRYTGNVFMVTYVYEGGVLVTEGWVYDMKLWREDSKQWKYINSSLLNGRKLNKHRANIDYLSNDGGVDQLDKIHTMGTGHQPEITEELLTIADTPIVDVAEHSNHGIKFTTDIFAKRASGVSEPEDESAETSEDDSPEEFDTPYVRTTEEEWSHLGDEVEEEGYLDVDDLSAIIDSKLIPIHMQLDDIKGIVTNNRNATTETAALIKRTLDAVNNLKTDMVKQRYQNQQGGFGVPPHQQPHSAGWGPMYGNYQSPQQPYGYGHPQQPPHGYYGGHQQNPQQPFNGQQRHYSEGSIVDALALRDAQIEELNEEVIKLKREVEGLTALSYEVNELKKHAEKRDQALKEVTDTVGVWLNEAKTQE